MAQNGPLILSAPLPVSTALDLSDPFIALSFAQECLRLFGKTPMSIQGYLARKKTFTLLGTPQDPTHVGPP